jgi:hypothetical protein
MADSRLFSIVDVPVVSVIKCPVSGDTGLKESECQIGIRLFKSTQFLVNTRLHPEGEVIPKGMFIFA